jgi:hypothetical protein
MSLARVGATVLERAFPARTTNQEYPKPMLRLLGAAALAILCASCNATHTASISETLAEAPVRMSCPAFRAGPFVPEAARSYGSEQITTFRNDTNFHCRCIAKASGQAPTCSQVRRFTLGRIEEG